MIVIIILLVVTVAELALTTPCSKRVLYINSLKQF